MSNPNHLQNMVQTNHQQTHPNTTPPGRNNAIRIQTRPINPDAILKIEQYIQEGTGGNQILLMGLSEAFDTINRTQLWTTLYKKGLPLETITRIRKKGIKKQDYV